MIIDFHTHTFPPKIAAAALDKLSDNSGSRPYSNGMIDGLQDSIKKSGIDIALKYDSNDLITGNAVWDHSNKNIYWNMHEFGDFYLKMSIFFFSFFIF